MWFPGYQLFSGQLLSEGSNWFFWICAATNFVSTGGGIAKGEAKGEVLSWGPQHCS